MSVASEITRLQNAKSDIKTSIENKGVTVGNGTIDTYASKIDEISGGVDITDYYIMEKMNSNSIKSFIKKIPDIDMSPVTSMNSMFSGCSSLTELPQLDTSKVTDMSYMFSSCSSLTTIPQLDTSKVNNMNSMFNGCHKLTELPQLDTNKVTTMFYTFYSCSSLTNIPKLETTKVTNMNGMFGYCNNLTTIPQLDAGRVTDIGNIVIDTYKLTNFGGLLNLGQAYSTTQSANYYNYSLRLNDSNVITHDSLMNAINGLYDIKTKGCNPQTLALSSNISKLTSEEIAIATEKGWNVT